MGKGRKRQSARTGDQKLYASRSSLEAASSASSKRARLEDEDRDEWQVGREGYDDGDGEDDQGIMFNDGREEEEENVFDMAGGGDSSSDEDEDDDDDEVRMREGRNVRAERERFPDIDVRRQYSTMLLTPPPLSLVAGRL